MKADMKKITLAHGSGGALTHELIRELMLKKLANPVLAELADSAVIDTGGRIAFTTDSFVVNPLFFPGGDIGKLAVCGTVNDLAMQGAQPLALSLAMVIEEGLPYETLSQVVGSVAYWARRARVAVVTGDTKVVEKGACDKLFITTSGIGRMVSQRNLSVRAMRPGDAVIVTGDIGRHGMAVLSTRNGIDLGAQIVSDCSLLHELVLPLLRSGNHIRCMRDPTRGGLATTLNEFAVGSGWGIVIDEPAVPITDQVRAASELLGIDPLYSANEGCALIVVGSAGVKKVIASLKKHPGGRMARVIGAVVSSPRKRVLLKTPFGTQRILPLLTLEQLPRIC